MRDKIGDYLKTNIENINTILATYKKPNAKLEDTRKFYEDMLAEHKVFNIIKSKKVDVSAIITANCLDDYNDFNFHLTQEEFDLLKEYFK